MRGSSWTLHECKFEICQASVDLWPRMKIKSTVKPQLSQGVKCIIVPLCQSNNFPLDLELKIKHWTSVQTVAVSRINHENIGKKNLISTKHACDDSYNTYFLFSLSPSNSFYNSSSSLDRIFFIISIRFWFGYIVQCALWFWLQVHSWYKVWS